MRTICSSPHDDAAWTAARPLIELIAAAMEPITQAMAAALLGWDAAQQERVLEATALLFPVRDGKFHVFHKTAVDWLTGEITADSSLKSRSDVFHVERRGGTSARGRLRARLAGVVVANTDAQQLGRTPGIHLPGNQ